MEFNTAPDQDANCLADSRSARPARTRNVHTGGNPCDARGWCLVHNDERFGLEGPELPQRAQHSRSDALSDVEVGAAPNLLAKVQYLEGGVGGPAEEDASGEFEEEKDDRSTLVLVTPSNRACPRSRARSIRVSH